MLKAESKKKHPFRFEIMLRKELVSLIEFESGKSDADTIINKIVKTLSFKLGAGYAYERAIVMKYYNYFLPLLPKNKIDEEVVTKDYYIAVSRLDGKWQYYKIFPGRSHLNHKIKSKEFID